MTHESTRFREPLPDATAPWTRRALVREGVRLLEAAGVSDALRNVEWMLGEVLRTSRAMLYAYPERPVPPSAVDAFGGMLDRRRAREPLQYVLGYAEFFGLRLQVTPAVLIPRPETEQVVEAALHRIADVAAPRILDVGTGSGCIALAMAHARPDAAVTGCDVRPEALDVARANAAAHRLDVGFVAADMLSPGFPAGVPTALDLLVSNPPYIARAEADGLAPEVRDHEPDTALFAGEDPLLFYRALAGHAPRLLRPGGLLAVETHADHGPAVCDLLREAGLVDVALDVDLAGYPRIATARVAPER